MCTRIFRTTVSSILEAKKIRLSSYIENQHLQQSSRVPDNTFDQNKHGVYLNPCYKEFTGIIVSHKRNF